VRVKFSNFVQPMACDWGNEQPAAENGPIQSPSEAAGCVGRLPYWRGRIESIE
jgi:hypothetical protein